MAAPAGGRKRVTFTYHAPHANKVRLVGSFNDWNPAKTPLKREEDGVWKVQVLLSPGRHEYRLQVDGQWVDDPTAVESVPNEFGTHNGVRIVGAA